MSSIVMRGEKRRGAALDGKGAKESLQPHLLFLLGLYLFQIVSWPDTEDSVDTDDYWVRQRP